MTTNPEPGDRLTWQIRSGYRLPQARPAACRYACSCGTCNGTTRSVDVTVTKVVLWADNSADAYGVDDDGRTHQLRLDAPTGDLCY